MPASFLFLSQRLGSDAWKVGIDLTGIKIHNFSPHCLGYLQGQRTLPGARRSDQTKDGLTIWFHTSAVNEAIRVQGPAPAHLHPNLRSP